jgi:hypothetical protein
MELTADDHFIESMLSQLLLLGNHVAQCHHLYDVTPPLHTHIRVGQDPGGNPPKRGEMTYLMPDNPGSGGYWVL